MLSYSWNSLDEDNITRVDKSDYNSLIDLFASVLVNGCKYLIKKGIDRGYNNLTLEYPGVKGKLDINDTLKKSLLSRGKTVCIIDELEFDIIHNQIIKSTLYNLLRNSNLNSNLKNEVKIVYNNFRKISTIPLDSSCFKKVQLHRNNKYYDLLIKICKYIFEESTIDESNGDFIFKDFTRDDRKMARLFESFLFNFYSKELFSCEVLRETIKWDLLPINNSNESFLPKMFTDISIHTSQNQKIIIDAKYYSKTLVTHFDSESFHSANLYQLFSYLMNQRHKRNGENCIGVLIYPLVDKELHEEYKHGNHMIIVKTIDLDMPWKNIKKELLNLIKNIKTVHNNVYSA